MYSGASDLVPVALGGHLLANLAIWLACHTVLSAGHVENARFFTDPGFYGVKGQNPGLSGRICPRHGAQGAQM